mmetsp:Transcript_52207/g.62862  ORF Transcript_52207/g.62862 Transcript_52207/m.62862 type:complete len:553 (+) Transcript_52207:200-1858(+)|eukprot:CAMPEP_0172516440 /NCGR_PEP_ID=MMETSP1066-20121228/276252_1 /TAXON_ID=671091 /ORGANISM="Coscinodiscus wailesii, Strain CCMP2513" /LENGTH=552 /DNA_ID=CAMNT_0013297929 /DNA_START=141 /DNA_END=1799 /DNA_ORIENTATION=-
MSDYNGTHRPSSSYSSLNGLDRHNSSFFSDPLQATEGWLELFLTPSEKHTFSKWRERISDKSLSNRATKTIFDKVVTWVPDNIAPNLITVCGFVCLGHAWHVANLYGEHFPVACTWFAVLNIILFYVFNSIDSRHADRIRQRTALGELFKYSCDCCSTVFLSILTVYLLGGTDTSTQWYAVQGSQLVLFTKHLSAFHRNDGIRYRLFTGPGEVIMSIIIILVVRAVFGLDWLVNVYEVTLHKILHCLENHDKIEFSIEDNNELIDKISDPVALGSEAVMTFYYMMYITAIIKTLMLRHPHGWSRFGLSTSLLMRFIPAIFIRFGSNERTTTVLDVISDGFFMAVLTSDVTLSKMAGREIHPWVVLMSFSAVLSHSWIIFLVVVYYIAVFADLCHYLNMPLLTVCRNVYCDGVYDLCHIGHKVLFRNALAYGNRLFVGVVGDKDASAYKRPPIMTHAERCAEVEACKSVTKVIQNAPCFGLTQDFLDEHQIHVVAFGEEYLERWPNPDDDIYYGHARKLGIAKPLPRTKGLSTSDLITRIQKAQPASEKKSPT